MQLDRERDSRTCRAPLRRTRSMACKNHGPLPGPLNKPLRGSSSERVDLPLWYLGVVLAVAAQVVLELRLLLLEHPWQLVVHVCEEMLDVRVGKKLGVVERRDRAFAAHLAQRRLPLDRPPAFVDEVLSESEDSPYSTGTGLCGTHRFLMPGCAEPHRRASGHCGAASRLHRHHCSFLDTSPALSVRA